MMCLIKMLCFIGVVIINIEWLKPIFLWTIPNLQKAKQTMYVLFIYQLYEREM